MTTDKRALIVQHLMTACLARFPYLTGKVIQADRLGGLSGEISGFEECHGPRFIERSSIGGLPASLTVGVAAPNLACQFPEKN